MNRPAERLAFLDAILNASGWLPNQAALNLLALHRLNPDPHEWTSLDELRAAMGLSRSGAITALNRLRHRGLIEYVSRRNPGGYLITRIGLPPADPKRPSP